jgi:hypothetical protein
MRTQKIFFESLVAMRDAILYHVQQYRNLKNLNPCKNKVLKRVSETNEEEILLEFRRIFTEVEPHKLLLFIQSY